MLGDPDAGQSQLCELGKGIGIVPLQTVILLDLIWKLRADEPARGLDEQLLLLGQ